jgi:hypothetical protein
MRITTTNYEDFKTFIAHVLGKTAVVFYGTYPHPHANEIVAIATNGNAMAYLDCVSGL